MDFLVAITNDAIWTAIYKKYFDFTQALNLQIQFLYKYLPGHGHDRSHMMYQNMNYLNVWI